MDQCCNLLVLEGPTYANVFAKFSFDLAMTLYCIVDTCLVWMGLPASFHAYMSWQQCKITWQTKYRLSRETRKNMEKRKLKQKENKSKKTVMHAALNFLPQIIVNIFLEINSFLFEMMSKCSNIYNSDKTHQD